MWNKDLVKLLKKCPNKELLIRVKGIYMAIEFVGLEDDFIIIKPRDDFEKIIQEIKFERNF